MTNLAKKLPHASAPAERRGDAKPLRKDAATPSPVAANPGSTATEEPKPQEADTAEANPKEIPMPTTLEQVLISLANVRTDFAERNEAITEKLAQIAAENAKRHQANEERLIKHEAATKQAIAELKADFVKWTVGMSLALFIAIISVLEYQDNDTPPPPAAPAVIQYLPAAPDTTAPTLPTTN